MSDVWRERPIEPHHSGGGMWQVREPGEPVDYLDWLNEIDGQALELGVDDLPEGIEDIRGSIYEEPERVFAIVRDDERGVQYVGLERVADVPWRELLVQGDAGDEAESLGSPDVLERAAHDLATGALVCNGAGGVQEWLDLFVFADGEEPAWDTPRLPVDWTGFAQAVSAGG